MRLSWIIWMGHKCHHKCPFRKKLGRTDIGRRRDDDGGREVGVGARVREAGGPRPWWETWPSPGAAGAGTLTSAWWCWAGLLTSRTAGANLCSPRAAGQWPQVTPATGEAHTHPVPLNLREPTHSSTLPVLLGGLHELVGAKSLKKLSNSYDLFLDWIC